MRLDILAAKRSFRKALGKKSLFWFGMLYFPEMFKFSSAGFHKRWCKLMDFKRNLLDKNNKEVRDENGKIRMVKFTYLILLAFRGSAKTSWAKIKIVRDICYARRKYIVYVCYEMDASKAALLDIAMWLQTNKKIIRDFGNLYYDKSLEKDQSTQKTIGNFLTSNGIRVRAVSIRKSMRGAVKAFDRPDAYVIDDFENNITKKSAALTRRAIDFFKELIGGMADDCEVIFVCNRISDIGSVQWILDSAEDNPNWIVDEVPAYTPDRKIFWHSKFSITKKKADERNIEREINNLPLIQSFEQIRTDLNKDGQLTFEQEYLLQPLVEGERFFSLNPIDERIRVLRAKKWQSDDINKPNYQLKQGNWIIWGAFKKGRRYSISSDVAEGYGLNSSTIEVFDLESGDQIMEFESDRVDPGLLGEEIFRVFQMAQDADALSIVVVERNSIGIGTIQRLRDLNCQFLYREKTIDKITDKPVKKYGWSTNSKTKPIMLFDFRRDFEKGLIGINSIPMLREMRAFSNSDVTETTFDPEVSQHYDRLMAATIGWQMKKERIIKGVR